MGQGTGKLKESGKIGNTNKKKVEIKMSDKTENMKNKDAVTGEEIADSPSEIRSQIEDTRQQMGETIDEIQERLSVSNITEQVKGKVSEEISEAWQSTKESVLDTAFKTTGEVMKYVDRGIDELSDTAVGRTARDNPLALTLIGAGIGILAYNFFTSNAKITSRKRMLPSAGNAGRQRNFASDNQNSALQTAKSKAGNAYETAADAAGNAYETATDAAGNVYETASDTAQDIYRKTGNVVSSAYDTAGNIGSQVVETTQELAHKAQDNYNYYIDENPLAVGAVALAVGAAVGMSIPSTGIESNFMGETRDNLMEQASQKVGNLIDTAQDTVQEKIEQAKTAAGNTAQTAIEETKKAADKTAQTALDEAKKAGENTAQKDKNEGKKNNPA